eukprot:NODE_2190_length_657_cov_58.044408_g1847_i0.p3 GENE.NODE_2190_length_657_cov_58.044408_g1847_i0~~NODE_2190_length_657_cov_58.044408_g1847_i0.p3  ORF type:complete len:104 (-),score=23.36 NODE_2190_length_657_cov_58.044408_g1847_i0:314-625(-)
MGVFLARKEFDARSVAKAKAADALMRQGSARPEAKHGSFGQPSHQDGRGASLPAPSAASKPASGKPASATSKPLVKAPARRRQSSETETDSSDTDTESSNSRR